MKRILTSVALVLVGAFAVGFGGVILEGSSVKAMTVRLSIKDLPERGVTLVDATSDDFDSLAAAKAKDGSGESKSWYSVYLRNGSDQFILAYNIRWEFTEPDGHTRCFTRGYSNFDAPFPAGWDPQAAHGDYIIRPGSVKYQNFLAGEKAVGVRNAPSSDQESESEKAATEQQAKTIQALLEELDQTVALTVSVDGVLFADGTFVGPDTAHFFNEMSQRTRARHDLYKRVADEAQAGRTVSATLDDVQALARPDLTMEKNPYEIFTQTYAKELRRMQGHRGEEATIAYLTEQLGLVWPTIRKDGSRGEENEHGQS